jgi:hypothetical protein
MKAVRLVRSGWWDDVVNGDAGRPLVLEDAAADEHIARGNAVYDPQGQAALDGQQATFVGPDEAARRMQAMQDLVDLTEEMGLYDNPVTPDEVREAEGLPPVKRPYGNHSKAAWIEWAVHQGADPAEAAAMTKAELQSLYGERL